MCVPVSRAVDALTVERVGQGGGEGEDVSPGRLGEDGTQLGDAGHDVVGRSLLCMLGLGVRIGVWVGGEDGMKVVLRLRLVIGAFRIEVRWDENVGRSLCRRGCSARYRWVYGY